MCVKILKVDEFTVCVEFAKLGGDQILFYENFKTVARDAMNFTVEDLS